MDKFLFWQRWLLLVACGITLFGIFMSFFSGTVLFTIFDSHINPVFWGAEPLSGSMRDFQKWVYGAWGATVAGWGIFIIFIVQYPFLKKEKWAWNCLTTGLLLWFCIDTGFSLYYHVYINALLNVIMLVLMMVPLVATRKYFG